MFDNIIFQVKMEDPEELRVKQYAETSYFALMMWTRVTRN